MKRRHSFTNYSLTLAGAAGCTVLLGAPCFARDVSQWINRGIGIVKQAGAAARELHQTGRSYGDEESGASHTPESTSTSPHPSASTTASGSPGYYNVDSSLYQDPTKRRKAHESAPPEEQQPHPASSSFSSTLSSGRRPYQQAPTDSAAQAQPQTRVVPTQYKPIRATVRTASVRQPQPVALSVTHAQRDLPASPVKKGRDASSTQHSGPPPDATTFDVSWIGPMFDKIRDSVKRD